VNILSDLPLNKDELKTAAKLFHGKLFVSFYYKPEQKFNGSVTLVTAKDNFVSLGPDYGLKPVCIIMIYQHLNLHRIIYYFFNFAALQRFLKHPFCFGRSQANSER